MPATIKDVALKAGVSVGTVSNVLNGKHGGPETCARVLDAVRVLSYHPNRIARSLVQRHSRTLGLTFANQGPSFAGNPFLTNILDGLVAASQEEGYNLTLYSRLRSGEEEQQVSTFLDRRIDALCIVAPNRDSRFLALLAETDLPFIVVGMEEPLPGVSWIDVDNALGAQTAMEHLFANGHTRIAHLAGSLQQKAAWTRAREYEHAMQARGYSFSPDWLIWCGFNEPGAYNASLRLLSGANRPTAIFAANDQIAMGVLAAARDLGIAVPAALSVIGFDDISEARIVTPPLTTIRQPVHEIGYAAAEYLIAVLRGGVKGPLEQRMAPTLVERESVGPLQSETNPHGS